MNPSVPPTWIMLVPQPADRVRGLIHRYLEDELDLSPALWDRDHAIQPTGNASCAVFSFAPDDTEGANPIAESLSTRFPGTIDVLELTDPPYSVCFEAGAFRVGTVDPFALAERYHLPLRRGSASHLPAALPSVRSVAVIELLNPSQARDLLAQSRGLPVPALLHFESVPLGTLVWSDLGDVQFAGGDIIEVRPNLVAYDVSLDSDRARFSVHVFGGSGEGHFVDPPETPISEPRLDAIKGETEPARILAALGVPPHRLNS